ncbi:MAG: DNA adenine methylase, partial [Deltaproteobacteria bacterium]|nr:DNA adenine methylase [Deltaproteobacteria bacterium]
QTPGNMLYLLARCVKGSVRYSRSGQFNQSPDKRRNGTNPINLSKNVNLISLLLNKKCKFSSLDYREILEMARPGDLIYMDPPYQGVSSSRDSRYCNGLDFDEFVESIRGLNSKGVDYLISYDGKRGDKEYGFELPKELRCAKILLEAGLSTQSTLLGERDITFESLYISNSLLSYVNVDNNNPRYKLDTVIKPNLFGQQTIL